MVLEAILSSPWCSSYHLLVIVQKSRRAAAFANETEGLRISSRSLCLFELLINKERFLQYELVPNVTEGNLSSTEVSNQISNDSFEIEDISGENSQENTTGHDKESSIYPQQTSTSSQEAPVSTQEASTSSKKLLRLQEKHLLQNDQEK
ncbi:unnamed protein product [Pieris macdunnoughi]|uniref:Uncharacterized protein n=1 Tax=Pieris macdunnoughi TaxID=345717 RepID=A0A821UKA8_9NEOP|nr:unnamed protein product [Pieris macdunnoughi]